MSGYRYPFEGPDPQRHLTRTSWLHWRQQTVRAWKLARMVGKRPDELVNWWEQWSVPGRRTIQGHPVRLASADETELATALERATRKALMQRRVRWRSPAGEEGRTLLSEWLDRLIRSITDQDPKEVVISDEQMGEMLDRLTAGRLEVSGWMVEWRTPIKARAAPAGSEPDPALPPCEEATVTTTECTEDQALPEPDNQQQHQGEPEQQQATATTDDQGLPQIRQHRRGKPVLVNGESYDSVKAAAAVLGLNAGTLRTMLLRSGGEVVRVDGNLVQLVGGDGFPAAPAEPAPSAPAAAATGLSAHILQRLEQAAGAAGVTADAWILSTLPRSRELQQALVELSADDIEQLGAICQVAGKPIGRSERSYAAPPR